MKKVFLAPCILVLSQIIAFAQPAAPGDLAASTLSATGIVLTWTDASSNESGFQIERSLTSGGGFSLVTTAASNTTSYINTGLIAGKQYFYRIRSTNAGGSSAYSSVVTTTTGLRRFLIDFGASTSPTLSTGWNNITLPTTGSVTALVESSGSASTLSLQIVKDPSNGYGTSNTAGSNIVVLDYPVSAASDSHYGWQSGGTYRLNGLDNSKVYNIRIFSSRMSISDSRKGAFTINGQQQLLESANNTSQTIVFASIVPTAGSITMDFSVGAGASFAYINVLDIVESSVTPQAPNNLTATASSSTQVNLAWVDASGNETGFQIERSLITGSGFVVLTTTAANTVVYSDAGLTAGTQYFYRVKAVNTEGSSGYTTEAIVTTLTATPSAPTTLTVTPQSSSQINLTWADNSNNETGFQIERSLTMSTGFTLIATAAANISTYSSTGLAPDTQYFYRVRAVNPGGSSAYTVEGSCCNTKYSSNSTRSINRDFKFSHKNKFVVDRCFQQRNKF